MSRDHRKLDVFHLADRLVPEVYTITKKLPDSERYGMQAQLRRAAFSTAANIVEGSSRRSDRDYCRFLDIAHGSAREASYALTLCTKLGYLPESSVARMADDYDHVAAMLLRLIESISSADVSRQTVSQRRS